MNQSVYLLEEPRGPSIIVEVPVTLNGQGRIPFPDVAQLRSTESQKIILKGMKLITDGILTNGVLNPGVTAPIAELQKMSIVLYCEGWEKGQFIPVLFLNDAEIPGTTIPFRHQGTYFDNWVNVDWPKSYIQTCNGTLTANQPYVVMFEVYYVKLDGQGNEIKRAS
jgi:hypothetical protein